MTVKEREDVRPETSTNEKGDALMMMVAIDNSTTNVDDDDSLPFKEDDP